MQQIVDDGILAVIAGADTTSSTITSIFYCILNDRTAYNELQVEVDRFYPAGEDSLKTTFHKDMPYLNAVM